MGWRLLLWVLLAAVLAFATAFLVPGPALPWSSLPFLTAGLGAGWTLLSLEGRPPGDLGFHARPTAAPETLRGFALGVGVGLAAVAAIALAGDLHWHGDAGTAAGWLEAGVATLWALAIPAAAEEALLRGYPLQALAEAWGAAPALVVTSVAFAALHLGNPDVGPVALLNVAAAGLFLGALVLRTGSLWWATGAHLGWNWAHAFLADVPVSGFDLVNAPLIEPSTSGPAWLSGGAFGPEGSVLATGVLAAAALWAWRTRRLSGGRFGSRGAGADRTAPTGVL